MAEFKAEEPKDDVPLHNDPVPEPEPLVRQDSAQEPEEPEAEQEAVDRLVPLSALHEERRRRQAAALRLRQMEMENERRTGVLQGRLDALERIALQARQEPEKPEEPEPDMEKDPAKWVQHQFRKRDKKLESVAEENRRLQEMLLEREEQFTGALSENHRRIQETERAQALDSTIARDDDEARSAYPDYDDAVEYVYELRHRQLDAVGITDPAQRDMMIGNEARVMAEQAYANGQSAADAIYRMARASGFGGARSPAAPRGDKLDNVRRGQQVSRTLARAPSRAAGGQPSLDDIANMSEAEFGRYVKDFESLKRMHGA